MPVGEAHRMSTVKARKRMSRLLAPGFQHFGCSRQPSKRFVCIPKPTLWVSPCHDMDARAVEQNSKPVCRARWRVHQEVGKDGRHWRIGDRDCPVTEPFARFLIRLPCRLVATPTVSLWMVRGIRQRYKRSFSRQPWLTSFPSRGTSNNRRPLASKQDRILAKDGMTGVLCCKGCDQSLRGSLG
jgi:hypothetical protein